jgi:hypothetical protein
MTTLDFLLSAQMDLLGAAKARLGENHGKHMLKRKTTFLLITL